MEKLIHLVVRQLKSEPFGSLKEVKLDLDLLLFIRYNVAIMKDLDTVVLTRNIEGQGLRKGDIGIMVHTYGGGKAVEVEFITAKGKTVAVLTLPTSDVRSAAKNEILHARGFTSI